MKQEKTLLTTITFWHGLHNEEVNQYLKALKTHVFQVGDEGIRAVLYSSEAEFHGAEEQISEDEYLMEHGDMSVYHIRLTSKKATEALVELARVGAKI